MLTSFPGTSRAVSASKSEIVLPIFDEIDQVFGVLDVDSDKLDDFSQADALGLRKIATLIENSLIARKSANANYL